MQPRAVFCCVRSETQFQQTAVSPIQLHWIDTTRTRWLHARHCPRHDLTILVKGQAACYLCLLQNCAGVVTGAGGSQKGLAAHQRTRCLRRPRGRSNLSEASVLSALHRRSARTARPAGPRCARSVGEAAALPLRADQVQIDGGGDHGPAVLFRAQAVLFEIKIRRLPRLAAHEGDEASCSPAMAADATAL